MKLLLGAVAFAALVLPASAQKRSPQLPQSPRTGQTDQRLETRPDGQPDRAHVPVSRSPRTGQADQRLETRSDGQPDRAHVPAKTKEAVHTPRRGEGRIQGDPPTNPTNLEAPVTPGRSEPMQTVTPRTLTPEERKSAADKKSAKMSGSN